MRHSKAMSYGRPGISSIEAYAVEKRKGESSERINSERERDVNLGIV